MTRRRVTISDMTHDPAAGGGPAGGEPATPVVFVGGFHRSGTTVLAAALTEAVGGVTTTVGALARHIPALAQYLARGGGDRGVDRLPVTAATPEEYGFLLRQRTGVYALYAHPDAVGVLREHVAELRADAPGAPVVLKNPHETAEERRLLADFPDARLLLVRRPLADIEASADRARWRTVEAGPAYSRALRDGDAADHAALTAKLTSPRRYALLRLMTRAWLCVQAFRLARSAAGLPPERVAFLDHDELRADPRAGAAWAAHLVDAEALAKAYATHVFEERSRPARGGPVVRWVDRRWARAWQQARTAQRAAGIIT